MVIRELNATLPESAHAVATLERTVRRPASCLHFQICADATISSGKPEISLTSILINNRMRAILVCIHIKMKQSNTPVPVQPATAPPSPKRPRVDSGSLLQGAAALEIDHGGQLYLLRVTRENKLILTK